MKRTATLLLACTAFGVTAQASAQSLSRGWDSYRQRQKQQIGTQGITAPAAQSARPAQAGIGGAPAVVGGSGTSQLGEPGGFGTVTEQTSARAVPAAPAYVPPSPREEEQRLKSGMFLGVQSGKAKVFENGEQDMQGFNVGYRWRAGPVTLIGIEAATGKVDGSKDADGFVVIPNVDFGSIGGTARFNFGDVPVFALVRLGYWGGTAKGEDYNERVYGAYVGAGLGVDIGRHVSLSALYTNYVYADAYYDDYEDLMINRAEVLSFGAEIRF
ncbi:porin family protein [Xanthomonas prunicola]|uniref:porin family protein n=1 Tax=Xanthomonas prunicola TaxID=2053930 RepID=UPI0021B23CD6|nr:porin family protein [Xanthomonas prunicola]UXA55265.1 porin family protein [Xanthomonas prunicola]